MKELAKATDISHPDHVYIQQAVVAMNSVASVRQLISCIISYFSQPLLWMRKIGFWIMVSYIFLIKKNNTFLFLNLKSFCRI